MGNTDKARNTARGVARYVRRTGKQSAQRLTSAVEPGPAADHAERGREISSRWLEQGRTRRDQLLERAGDTAIGQRLGRGTRRAGSRIQDLPILSAIMDTVVHKNGVVELRERLAADPTNPMTHIHLAEALRRCERDLRVYFIGRAAVNPSSVVVRHALRTAAGMDQEQTEPATRQLLRRAFALARERLAVDAQNPEALHAAARVYLIEEQPKLAVRFARRAVLAAPDSSGPALITLARGYVELGHESAARNAATMAIERGMTIGHQVLASLSQPDTSNGWRDHLQIDGEDSARVCPEDRRAYNGVAYSPSEVLRTVTQIQREKTQSAATDLGAAARTGTAAARSQINRRWPRTPPESDTSIDA